MNDWILKESAGLVKPAPSGASVEDSRTIREIQSGTIGFFRVGSCFPTRSTILHRHAESHSGTIRQTGSDPVNGRARRRRRQMLHAFVEDLESMRVPTCGSNEQAGNLISSNPETNRSVDPEGNLPRRNKPRIRHPGNRLFPGHEPCWAERASPTGPRRRQATSLRSGGEGNCRKSLTTLPF